MRCLLLRRKKKISILYIMLWLWSKFFINGPVITTNWCDLWSLRSLDVSRIVTQGTSRGRVCWRASRTLIHLRLYWRCSNPSTFLPDPTASPSNSSKLLCLVLWILNRPNPQITDITTESIDRRLSVRYRLWPQSWYSTPLHVVWYRPISIIPITI